MQFKKYLINNFTKDLYRKTLCPVPLMKLEKSRSSIKFDINLDYFLFE